MKYEFYYPHSEVTQSKLLIPHTEYLKFKVLPEDSGKEEKRKKKLEKEITQGKEWFTDKSPLFRAIYTGILNCNGIFKCKVKKL
mgnify:CR=1 FL=1